MLSWEWIAVLLTITAVFYPATGSKAAWDGGLQLVWKPNALARLLIGKAQSLLTKKPNEPNMPF